MNQLAAFNQIVSQEFKFRRERHVSDLGLEVTEDWLKQCVLLIDCLFVVKDCLHPFVVALIREHGQALELLLVLMVV